MSHHCPALLVCAVLLGACERPEASRDAESAFTIAEPALLNRPAMHAAGTWGPWLAWITMEETTWDLHLTSLSRGEPLDSTLVSRMEPESSAALTTDEGQALLAWLPVSRDKEIRALRWLRSETGETPPAEILPLPGFASQGDRRLRGIQATENGWLWVMVSGDGRTVLVHPLFSDVQAIWVEEATWWAVGTDENGVALREADRFERHRWSLDARPLEVTGLWRWEDRTWVGLAAEGDQWLARDDLAQPAPISHRLYQHQCAPGPEGLLCAVAVGDDAPTDIVLQDLGDDSDPFAPPSETLGRGSVPAVSRHADDQVLVTWNTDSGLEGRLLGR